MLYRRKARLILDVLEYYTHNDLDGILPFFDFKMALDSVEYYFVFITLKKFNFGDKLIEIKKKTVYNDHFF